MTLEALAHRQEPDVDRIERVEIVDDRLVRRVLRRDGRVSNTDAGPAPPTSAETGALHALADQRFLQLVRRPVVASSSRPISVVDLFSGIGSLSLGVIEAARAVGLNAEILVAADVDRAPLEVLQASLAPRGDATRRIDLGAVLCESSTIPNAGERSLLQRCRPEIDVLVAGPRCQGHSRLNNHTRHNDPRNDLYGCVARFVELARPRLCVIENVDSVVHDQRGAVAKVSDRLRALSYSVDSGPVPLHRLGVPQTRRRHVLVATRADQPSMRVDSVVNAYATPSPERRDVHWAISDLRGRTAGAFDQPSMANLVNRERMRWLHETGQYNLPNDRRPPCHQVPKSNSRGEVREHSYRSMYGRLHWEKPAQTITSGYGSMGQGRYVHPSQPRTLTPHEAARLQFIPDFFDFTVVPGRQRWAKMIGNVAPMKLSYVFALELLR